MQVRYERGCRFHVDSPNLSKFNSFFGTLARCSDILKRILIEDSWRMNAKMLHGIILLYNHA